MNRIIKFTGTMVAIFGMLMISNSAVAQGNNVDCNTVVASDCVGACGSGSTIGHVATANGFVSVTSTSSSLCPNTGVRVSVTINGKNKGTVDVTEVGTGRRFHVKAGDLVQVTPSTYSINNGVQCIWLGELVYAICE